MFYLKWEEKRTSDRRMLPLPFFNGHLYVMDSVPKGDLSSKTLPTCELLLDPSVAIFVLIVILKYCVKLLTRFLADFSLSHDFNPNPMWPPRLEELNHRSFIARNKANCDSPFFSIDYGLFMREDRKSGRFLKPLILTTCNCHQLCFYWFRI